MLERLLPHLKLRRAPLTLRELRHKEVFLLFLTDEHGSELCESHSFRTCGIGTHKHHARMTFEEEFIALLKKHGIEYDPRYVFG